MVDHKQSHALFVASSDLASSKVPNDEATYCEHVARHVVAQYNKSGRPAPRGTEQGLPAFFWSHATFLPVLELDTFTSLCVAFNVGKPEVFAQPPSPAVLNRAWERLAAALDSWKLRLTGDVTTCCTPAHPKSSEMALILWAGYVNVSSEATPAAVVGDVATASAPVLSSQSPSSKKAAVDVSGWDRSTWSLVEHLDQRFDMLEQRMRALVKDLTISNNNSNNKGDAKTSSQTDPGLGREFTAGACPCGDCRDVWLCTLGPVDAEAEDAPVFQPTAIGWHSDSAPGNGIAFRAMERAGKIESDRVYLFVDGKFKGHGSSYDDIWRDHATLLYAIWPNHMGRILIIKGSDVGDMPLFAL